MEPIPLWQQRFPHLESHLETATGSGNVLLEGNPMGPWGISLSLWMWLWLLDCRLPHDGQCSPWEEGSCVLSQFSIFPSWGSHPLQTGLVKP